jgi:hypothetical protein
MQGYYSKQHCSAKMTVFFSILVIETGLRSKQDTISVDTISVAIKRTRNAFPKKQLVGPTLYDKAFDEFCLNVIEKRIIQNGDILLLSYLFL